MQAMTQMHPTLRPASAAIAAVLACSSTTLFAQEIGSPSPALAVGSTPSAPVTSATTQPLRTVQSLPPSPPPLPVLEPLDEAIAPAAPAARAASQAAPRQVVSREAITQARVPAERPALTAPSAVTADRAPAPQQALTPVPQSTEPAASSPLPRVTNSESTQHTATDADSDGALWAAAGAGALLLAGGIALAARRRRPEAVLTDENRPSVIERDKVSTPPVVAPVTSVVAPQRASDFASQGAVSSDEPVRHLVVVDAMASDRPTAENPFLTRRNRRRRADFLLRTGQAEPAPAAAPPGRGQAPHADRVQPDRYSSFRIGGRLTPRPGERVVPG